MHEWTPPILGLMRDAVDIAQVVWKDGTVVAGGILGSSEELAATLAELTRRDDLRQRGIAIWMTTDEFFQENQKAGAAINQIHE